VAAAPARSGKRSGIRATYGRVCCSGDRGRNQEEMTVKPLTNTDYCTESRRVVDALTKILGPGNETQIQFEHLAGKYPETDSIWPDFYTAAKQELNELRNVMK
jgi:hypothetical protein